MNCWYQRGCNWNVYVKDGLVWREEQSGTYDQIDPKIPDYNPRGCQKGACYSERMYDESRQRQPLQRVGARGGGLGGHGRWLDLYRVVVATQLEAPSAAELQAARGGQAGGDEVLVRAPLDDGVVEVGGDEDAVALRREAHRVRGH